MTTIGINSASKALGSRLSKRYAKNANVTSGFIATVTNDSTGRPKTAAVQLPGGTTVSVPVPYGSNIYPGISVALVNDGSPSLASWRISNSSSASPITLGGQIVNTNGSTVLNFDSIWVKDRGFLMAGGMEDILGEPTGPRVIMNEYGLFGYAIPFPEPVISIATIEADNLHVGDVLLGYQRPGHANFLVSPEQGLIQFSVDDAPFLTINGGTGNRLEDYLWIGPSSGPQVGMGKMLGVAEFAMRDTENRYVFLVSSDPMRVQVGATDDAEGWLWDAGRLTVRGAIYATSGTFTGTVAAGSGTIGGWILGPTTLSSVNGEVQLSSVNGLNIVSDDSGMDAVSNTNSVNWYDELGFANRTARIYGSTGIAEHNLVLEGDGRALDYHGKVSLYATGGTARTGAILLRAEGNDLETDGASLNVSATGSAGGATVNVIADEFNVTGAASVDLTDAATAVISSVLALSHNSSGTPATYFGGSLPLKLKSTTTDDRPAASIDWLWADPTHGTETAALIISTAYGGNVGQVAKFGGTLGTVLNEDGNAWCDLRVESDNYDALFIDASNDSIAIMNHASGKISFFAATPTTKPTGVAVTAAGIHAALVSLGLIAA